MTIKSTLSQRKSRVEIGLLCTVSGSFAWHRQLYPWYTCNVCRALLLHVIVFIVCWFYLYKDHRPHSAEVAWPKGVKIKGLLNWSRWECNDWRCGTLQLYCLCVEKFASWFVIYIKHSIHFTINHQQLNKAYSCHYFYFYYSLSVKTHDKFSLFCFRLQ